MDKLSVTVIADATESDQHPRAHATWNEGQRAVIIAWDAFQISVTPQDAVQLRAALDAAIRECDGE